MKSRNYLLILLSLTLTGMPASNACELLNKPTQIGKEWTSDYKIKYTANVNNERIVRCDSKYMSGYDLKETYGIYAEKTYSTAYECEQFSIIHQRKGFNLDKEVWILVDKNKKKFDLNAEKSNCVCKDTGTNEKRKITHYCSQILQEDFTKIQLKSENEYVITDKERPQL